MRKMARQHGGKRVPRQPAPASGPGRMSRRTDGGPQQVNAEMTGMPYGENSDFMDIQSSAPMAAAPSTRMGSGRGRGAGRPAKPKPLFAPSSRPDEPVTAGAPVGPGDGPSRLPDSKTQARQDAKMLSKYLPDLMQIAQAPETPDGFKRFVRYLRNVSN